MQGRRVRQSDEDMRRERNVCIQFLGLCWGDEATTIFLSACSLGLSPAQGSTNTAHSPLRGRGRAMM
eukprot:COSAG01_NODE_8146_length_2904_cov_10.815686_6_plen_67_part_00